MDLLIHHGTPSAQSNGKFNFPIFQIGKLEEKCSFPKVGPDFLCVPFYSCSGTDIGLKYETIFIKECSPISWAMASWLWPQDQDSHFPLATMGISVQLLYISKNNHCGPIWLPLIKGKGIITLSKYMPKSLHWNGPCYAPLQHSSSFSLSSNTLPPSVSLSLNPLFCLKVRALSISSSLLR